MQPRPAISADVRIRGIALLDAEREEVLDASRSVGLSVSITFVPPRRGLGDLQWLTLVALPLHAFLSGLGDEFASDASQRLRAFVRAVLKRRQRPVTKASDLLVLQDIASGIQVVLEADLPTEGYEQLLSLDFSRFERGPLHYDRQLGGWRSELDEWKRRASHG